MTEELEPYGRSRLERAQRWTIALLVAALTTGSLLSLAGRPAPPASAGALAPAPSWIDPDTASRLALGFAVLVPGWIPAPFADQPAVTASEGSYELYWVITGGDPTFLDITGTVGGDIPDFSWYDRNNELQQNAEVGGVPAYRDLTPIYDNVYWQVGDVVYTVSSQGLTETDSLSLANALVPLDQEQEPTAAPPSPPAPTVLSVPATVTSGSTITVTISNAEGATLAATGGIFPDTRSISYDGLTDATVIWTAPTVSTEQAVTFSLVDPSTGSWLVGATTLVLPPPPPPAALICGGPVSSGEQARVTVSDAGTIVVDASSGFWPGSGGNSSFDRNAGGTRLTGTIPDGPVELLWQAPATDSSLDATIIVSSMNGTELASCVIAISPAAAAQRTAEPSRPASAILPAPTRAPDDVAAPASRATTADGTRSAASPTIPHRSAEGSVARRNRPTRSAEAPSPTPISPAPIPHRMPENDGTGGPLYPRYSGVPRDVGGVDPMLAPTSAPMPSPPRTVTGNLVPSPTEAADVTGASTPAAAAILDVSASNEQRRSSWLPPWAFGAAIAALLMAASMVGWRYRRQGAVQR